MPKLIKGTLLTRRNRFLAEVKLVNGEEVESFVADPGRLKELLFAGADVYLAPAVGEGRKTGYDLRLVRTGAGLLVSIDSRVPNRLLAKALRAQRLEPFQNYTDIRSEPPVPNGRLDFFLSGPAPACYLEVKSCTLVRDGQALFPDAPTARGQKHVKELIRLLKTGCRTAILFLVQREDAASFSPHKMLDPAFSQALAQAWRSGVEVYAYDCRINLHKIALGKQLPLDLD